MKFWMISTLLLITSVCQAQLIRVSGVVSNFSSSLVRIQDNNRNVMDTATLDAQGRFSLEFEGSAGEYAFYTHKETSAMFLQPGDDLTLKLNVDSFDETIEYEGVGAAPNNYLAQLYMLEERLASVASLKQMVMLEEAAFVHRLDSVVNLKRDLLRSYGLEVKIEDRMSRALEFEQRYAQYIYPVAHAYWGKVEGFEVSEHFPDAFADLELNRGDLASMTEYILLLNAYIQEEMKSLTDSGVDAGVGRLMVIDETFTDQILREQLVQSQAQYQMMNSAEPEVMFEWYQRLSTDAGFIARQKEQLAAMRAIEAGSPSPSFSIPDSSGQEHELEELRGRYVYIDIWATWCGPCMREVPFYKQLHADYHDKNIVFVGIAMNDNYARWKQGVKRLELEGLQLFSDSEDQPFFDHYMVLGIPRYILLDPNGKIVDADAPRPSEDALRELLDELL